MLTSNGSQTRYVLNGKKQYKQPHANAYTEYPHAQISFIHSPPPHPICIFDVICAQEQQ